MPAAKSNGAAHSGPTPDTEATPNAPEANGAANGPDRMDLMMATFLGKLEELSTSLNAKIEAVRQEATQRAAEPPRGQYEPPPPMGYDEPIDGSYVPLGSAQGAGAGLIPPPSQGPTPPSNPVVFDQQQKIADPNSRLVAFIPKTDQLNPKALLFEGWINGKYLRSKRGEPMMAPLGYAVDIAKSGHGYVVDIAAMSSVTVIQNPDFSRPDDAMWPSEVPPVQPRSIPYA